MHYELVRAGLGVGTWDLYAFLTAAPRGRRARGCYEIETRILKQVYTTVRNRDDRRPRVVVVDTKDASESFESKLPRGALFCGEAAVSRKIASSLGSTSGVLSRDRRLRGGFRRRGAGDAAATPRMSARNEASSS